jgi:trimethylamine-N-oxide reductase (cytochrome c)
LDVIRSQIWSGRPLLNHTKQLIPKTQFHQAILEGHCESWGNTSLYAHIEDQFKKYTYPIPKEEGGSEVHMIWMDNPCRSTCWNNSMESIQAFRSPKIETFVVQHPWLENDSIYADIILPINTKLEERDFAQISSASPMNGIAIEERAIAPLGESLSDYEAAGEVAKKLGLYEEYTDGLSIDEKIKWGYEASGCAEVISWEELLEKGYYYIRTEDDWERYPAGMRLFYEDPEKHPLKTPTGKLEFFSQRLADHFPDDEERPPYPKWIEKGPSHDERLSSERAKKYPMLLVSNHPRWRTHAENDDITWTREIPTCKVKGHDGYMYEPVWIHPTDAEARGIKSGDIVKLFNERGTVLGGAIVWERIMPGVTYQDHGARADMISTEPGNSIDRGGANNLISPANGTSQNCWGMATSGYLVDVQKVTGAEMQEWREKYPQAFERDYSPGQGLRYLSWIRGEE